MNPPVPEGRKDDGGKLTYHLLAWDAIAEVVKVLMFGARKYAPRNWEAGIAYSRVYDAAIRHLTAWWGGEETDPETGLSHLAHAMCCIMFLLAYRVRVMVELDDRPKPPSKEDNFYKQFNHNTAPQDNIKVRIKLLDPGDLVPLGTPFQCNGFTVIVVMRPTVNLVSAPNLATVSADITDLVATVEKNSGKRLSGGNLFLIYDEDHVMVSGIYSP